MATALAVSLVTSLAPILAAPAQAQETAGPRREPMVSRTATSVTTTFGDGTASSRIYTKPVNYQDDRGVWQARNDSLVRDPGGFRRSAGPGSIRFGATADDEIVRVADDDWAIAFTLEDAASGRAGAASGNAIEYRDVVDGVDLRYRVSGDTVKEDLVLQKAPARGVEGPAAGTARFLLDLTNATPSAKADGSISFVDRSGAEVATVPPGVAYDSAGFVNKAGERVPGIHTATATVANQLDREADGRWVIETSVDRAWLFDSRRIFPVVLDPQVILGRETAADDYWGSEANYEFGGTTPTEMHDGPDPNQAYTIEGRYDDETIGCEHDVSFSATTYVHFDLGDVAGRPVTQAYFYPNVQSGSAVLEVGAATSWPFSAGTRPEGRTSKWVDPGLAEINVTTIVAGWAGGWNNYGFALSTAGVLSFYSVESGWGPYIDVRYVVAPGPVRNLGGATGDRSATATWDLPANGEQTGFYAELWSTTDGALKATRTLTSGLSQSVTFTAADGVLNNWTYTIKVRATNVAGTSAFSQVAGLIPRKTALPGGIVVLREAMSGGSVATENLGPCNRPQSDKPVDIASGEFWHAFDDLVIPGRGVPLRLSHTYSTEPSTLGINGPLGHGWTFNYHMRLDLSDPAKAVVREENGAGVVFDRPSFTHAPRVIAELVGNADGTYTYTRRKTEIFDFDATGALIRLKDRDGYTTAITRPNASTMVVTDPSNRSLTFAYTGGHLTSVTDPMTPPRTVSFSYDASNDLRQVTDVAGGVTSFTYDASHRMLTMRFPKYHGSTINPTPVITNHYDTSGRVDWQSDQLGRVTTFDYAPAGEPVDSTLVTDPKGDKAVYRFENGLLASKTLGYGTPQAATWLHDYDPDTIGCTEITDPNGHATSAEYDDPLGSRTSSTDALGRTTTWDYNDLGQMEAVTDPSGVRTDYTYDGAWGPNAGHLTRVSTPLKDAAGNVVDTRVTTYRYEDPAKPGDLTSMSDPNHPYLNASSKQWKYHYDANGLRDEMTSPLGNKTTWAYNDAGWLLEAVAPKGYVSPNTSAQYTTTYEEYTAFGDLKKARNPLGQLVVDKTYDANRNPATSRDAKGNVTSYMYDAADQLLSVDRPAPASDLSNQYWPDGSLKLQRDGAGKDTQYGYDALGRLTTVTDPLARTTTYGYDPVGNLTTKQAHSGSCGATPKTGCTTFGYDVADQLKTVIYSDGTTPNVTNTTYDDNGRRRTQTLSNGATASWNYDSLGRLTDSSDSSGMVRHLYDIAGTRTKVAYPGGSCTAPVSKCVTYGVDDDSQVTSMTDWNGNVTQFGYDENGNLDQTTFPAATTNVDEYGFDRADRMTSVTMRKGATTLAAIDPYGRDADGQVAAVTQTGLPDAATESFGYSSINQLTTRNGATGWAYDAADNLTGLPTGYQGFDAANQLCFAASAAGGTCAAPPAGATTFGYDARGNRTSTTPAFGTASSYTYDQADRLVAADRADVSRAAAVGWYHSLVAKSDGTVWAFGYNVNGQLGTGSTTDATSPTQVAGMSGVASVAGGAFHSLALKADGTVWASGYNWWGQLGTGTTADAQVFTKVAGLTDVVAISAGAYHSLALRADGTVWSWGLNDNGQLGNNSTTQSNSPVQVQGLSGVAQINGGANHSVARKSDGTVWAWGYNGWGHLGNNATADSHVPVQAQGLSGVASLSTGHHHSLALRNDGTVWTWGFNGYGQLGNNSTTNSSLPSQLSGLSNVASVAAGGYGSAVVKADKTVSTWGSNAYGSLGTGSTTDSLVPTAVGGLTSVAGLSPGAVTTLAVRADGSVWAWGNNNTGAVGDGTTITPRTSPQAVPGLNRGTSPLASYTYRSDGLRASKTVAGQTRTMTWDESGGLPLLLSDGERSYLYGVGGAPLAQVDAAGTITYLHHDQLGSTRLLTDASGATVGTFSFDPYGTISGSTGTVSTPFGFAGEYRDAESGLIYLRARYYDPATGQFLTRDPIEAVTREPYGYVGGNPLNWTDPSGLCWGPTCLVEDAVEAVDDVAEFAVRNRHTIIDVGTTFGGAALTTACIASVACGVAAGGLGLAAVGLAGASAHIGSDQVFRDDHQLSTSEALFRGGYSSASGAACALLYKQGCFPSAAMPAGRGFLNSRIGLLGMSRAAPGLFLANSVILKQGLLKAFFW